MTLNSWQELLVEYFAALRQRLDANGNRRPLFALEHKLDPSKFGELVQELKIHTDNTGPADRHWAVWSVYATEIGYRFCGDEYWQTFAEDLPGWAKHEDRNFIRNALYRFYKQFQGPVPSGNWAKTFTIICWPITNAILPKDLQKHLASTLYDIRDSFTPDLLSKPEDLGRLIAVNADRSSSRFRRFANEHELVGRIAVALLRTEAEDANDLLEPHTLKRITQDLLAVHNARLWLQAARQRASNATMHGVRTKSFQRPAPSNASEGPARTIEECRERLELTARKTAEDCWSIKAILPNLSHLESQNSAFQTTFATRRSYIDVSDRTHFAPRAFTVNRQEVRLKDWPRPRKSIVRFEPSPPGLCEMLDRSCAIDDQGNYLFRLREDNEAIPIRSRTLRPDSQYLFVSTRPFPASIVLHGSKRVRLSCEGLDALYIEVPEHVSSFYVEAAQRLGLEVRTGIDLAPVGYPTRMWTGDGEVSWNLSSPKILGVTTNIEVSSIAFDLAGENWVKRIESPIMGRGPLFVDLSDLGIGSYQLRVTTQIPSASTTAISGELDIEVVADSDQVLSPDSAQGFKVLTSPTLPTLEQLWSGSTKIEVFGPFGAQISVRVKFYSDAEAKIVDWDCPAGKLTLPVRDSDWNSLFQRLKENRQAQTAYERAASCRLVFRSIDLGESTLDCEREFVPFRWSVRTKNSSQMLTLVRNDSRESISLMRSRYERPDCFEPFVLDAKGESEERGPGGLVVARTDSSFAALILPQTTMSSLSSLGAVITHIQPRRDARGLVALSDSLMLWNDAELLGDPISLRKRNGAIESLKSAVIESVCGSRWLTLETDVENGRKSLYALTTMVTSTLPSRIQQTVSDIFRHAHQLSKNELADLALDMAKMARLVRDSESEMAAFRAAFLSLLGILSVEQDAHATVPKLDEGAAHLALKSQVLMQFIRLVGLITRRHRADEQEREATA